MRAIFGIPWPLLAIRLVLLVLIPALLFIVPSEGGGPGYAMWWAGIMVIAFSIIHWRDAVESVLQVITVVLVGVVMSLLFCFGAWWAGFAFWGLESTPFNFDYPSVSAGINEMLLAGYFGLAVVHAVLEAVILGKMR